jgi:hypothetical protein
VFACWKALDVGEYKQISDTLLVNRSGDVCSSDENRSYVIVCTTTQHAVTRAKLSVVKQSSNFWTMYFNVSLCHSLISKIV